MAMLCERGGDKKIRKGFDLKFVRPYKSYMAMLCERASVFLRLFASFPSNLENASENGINNKKSAYLTYADLWYAGRDSNPRPFGS